jgi:2-oxoglutarate dehydrogenase E2 component (dihydrolipoamide succinyltransferase)
LPKVSFIFLEVGDFVELDEIIAVIETDKVKVDIRSPEKGMITKFHASLGDTV